MTGTLHVLGICGSLRTGSYNRGLLAAAQELAPAGMTIEIADLHDIPFYVPELDTDTRRPAAVRQFKRAIANANVLLIATPEYNHSITGVLKNAIDWASRPVEQSPLNGKPAAIMGATGGLWGTIRAQDHLRDILRATGTPVVRKPEILVSGARGKFDESGRLTDEPTRQFVRQLLDALADLAQREQRSATQVATTSS